MMSRTSGILIGASLFAFVTFSSCGGTFGKDGNDSAAMKEALEKAIAENNLVKVQSGGYQMSIPKRMSEDTALNDAASLEYADKDPDNELYVIVIHESKTDFIKAYSDPDYEGDYTYDDNLTPEKNYRMEQMKSLTDGMTIKGKPEITKSTINGLDAEIVGFTASAPEVSVDVFYKLAFIEGTKNIYMIMSWTAASQKSANEEEMDQMIQSFKLLDAK
jgi:hypothetical protein